MLVDSVTAIDLNLRREGKVASHGPAAANMLGPQVEMDMADRVFSKLDQLLIEKEKPAEIHWTQPLGFEKLRYQIKLRKVCMTIFSGRAVSAVLSR